MELEKNTAACLRAFHNVVESINAHKRLPDQVFEQEIKNFRIFDSGYLTSSNFADRLREMIEVEAATCCCLLNYSQTDILEYQTPDFICLDRTTTPDQYKGLLWERHRLSGWNQAIDRFGCASDRGGWCIYSESQGEIAIIGFKSTEEISRYSKMLQAVSAVLPSEIIGDAGFLSYGRLLGSWKNGIRTHYHE